MTMTTNTIDPQQLKTWLHDGDELALIDVREQAAFFDQHLLFACCLPLSRIELLIADLVPRITTRVVLCDSDEDGLAVRAAQRLQQLGYSSVSVLKEGINGWRSAGFELFSGINVPSKAFGEYIEIKYDTPRLTAEELHSKIAAGENMVILDSRPMEEFNNMSIPGGIDCPGAELAYRVHDAAPDPETLVVVNCAGRTRSIIGTQSLVNAGIPNQVMALKDGTMGWALAGFKLARGETEHAAAPSAAGLVKAKAAAQCVAERFGVHTIDHDTLRRWQKESAQRTLYLLDVRSPKEYQEGHLANSRNAPGGQLVQATDEYMATRNARVVLVDDTQVRATMTASWLLQMGWDDVYVLEQGLADETLVPGTTQPRVLGLNEAVAKISATQLKTMQDEGQALAVLDLATSLQYRKQHIPGAWWGMRTRIEQAFAALSEHQTLVLTSPDGLLAQLTANDYDLQQSGTFHRTAIKVLEGGNDAWKAAGYSLVNGDEQFTCETNDVWYKPYQHRTAVEQAMQDYLTWEVNLVEQIERDGDARFR